MLKIERQNYEGDRWFKSDKLREGPTLLFSLFPITQTSIANEHTYYAASASEGDHQLHSAPNHSILGEISAQTTVSLHSTNQLHCCKLIQT